MKTKTPKRSAKLSAREFFEFAPTAHLVVRGDGIIDEVNRATLRLLGGTRNGLIKKPLHVQIAEENRGEFQDLLKRTLANGAEPAAPATVELAVMRRDGTSVEVHAAMVLLKGSSRRVLIAMEDVTPRKRAHEALRAESRHKDDFLAALSHELRNPLMPLRSAFFVLEQAGPGAERARKAQSVIHRQLNHLTRIVDDLLDVTRIARGKVLLQRQRVELGDLVRRTVDDHRPVFDEAEVSLEIHRASELFWVDADPTRLVQVVGNLLGNAVKFTPRSGKVEVSLRREGSNVVLSVRDSGIGIDPEIQERLFEPFSQAPQSLDRTRGGLGLGLAMAKGLMELHGGTIDVSSSGLGQGAEFLARLPLAEVQVGGPVEADLSRRPRFRVLLIEDNSDAAEMLQETLRIKEHQVEVAHDGPSALTLARNFHPEVVLCDIGLPKMDGYAVAQAFRKDKGLKDSFLIALTGYARPEDVRRSAEAGFDRHLAKPPDLDELEGLLSEIRAPSARASG